MDSWWTRISNLISWFVAVLALCGAYNYLTGQCFFTPHHKLELLAPRASGLSVNKYLKADQIAFDLNFKADLTDAFHWHTHQLFIYLLAEYQTKTRDKNEVIIWDHIARHPAEANLTFHRRPAKYYFRDYGKGHIASTDFTLSLKYQFMPKTGTYWMHQVGSVKSTFPSKGSSQRSM